MNLPDFAVPPAMIVVTDIDHLLFSRRSWWPFVRKPKDDLPARVTAAETILVGHRELADLLREHYGVAPEKIRVVGHGPSAVSQAVDSVSRRITKEVYGREASYFLAPVTGHPADNLACLFPAYDRFRARCPEPVRLLLPLAEKDLSRADRRSLKGLRHRSGIDFLPRLSPVEYRKVFASARAILYPSLSSRFPMPIVDAWYAEVPVLAAQKSVLGGGGAQVQAKDQEDIAAGMVSLVTTPFLASGLVENGKQRRELFSWERVREAVALPQ